MHSRATGYLTLMAVAKYPCRHGYLATARRNKYKNGTGYQSDCFRCIIRLTYRTTYFNTGLCFKNIVPWNTNICLFRSEKSWLFIKIRMYTDRAFSPGQYCISHGRLHLLCTEYYSGRTDKHKKRSSLLFKRQPLQSGHQQHISRHE